MSIIEVIFQTFSLLGLGTVSALRETGKKIAEGDLSLEGLKVKCTTMPGDRGEMNSALNKLLSISESEGASILSSDGYIIGLKFKNKFIHSKLAEFLSEFIITAISIISKADFGNPEQILIQGTERKILIHKAQKKNFYAILFGTSKMNTGLASTTMKKMIPFIEKIIQ